MQSIQLLEVNSTTLVSWLSMEPTIILLMLSRSESAFFILLTSHSKEILMLTRARVFMSLSIDKEDNNSWPIILELTLSLLPVEKFLDHTSGNMVPKRQPNRLTWILLTIKVWQSRKNRKSRTLQIELLMDAVKSTRASWIKLKLRRTMDSIFTKEVLSLETH